MRKIGRLTKNQMKSLVMNYSNNMKYSAKKKRYLEDKSNVIEVMVVITKLMQRDISEEQYQNYLEHYKYFENMSKSLDRFILEIDSKPTATKNPGIPHKTMMEIAIEERGQFKQRRIYPNGVVIPKGTDDIL